MIVRLSTVAGLTVSLKVVDTFPTVADRMALSAPRPVTRLGSVAVANSATDGVSLDQTA